MVNNNNNYNYNYNNNFYGDFDTLMAFLMECLNWRCSFGGSVYVVGSSSSKGLLHGTLGVDYFHNKTDVIAYCQRNGFQIVYGNDFDYWLSCRHRHQGSRHQGSHHHHHHYDNKRRMCMAPTEVATEATIACPNPPRKRARCVTPPHQSTKCDNYGDLSLRRVQGMEE